MPSPTHIAIRNNRIVEFGSYEEARRFVLLRGDASELWLIQPVVRS